MDTERELYRNLERDYSDITKIIIAQRITSVMHADRIIIMDDGKIDEIGTPKELLSHNKIFQEIYASQKKGEA